MAELREFVRLCAAGGFQEEVIASAGMLARSWLWLITRVAICLFAWFTGAAVGDAELSARAERSRPPP
ncbi:MAG: hypothetical protein PVG33_07050 [Chloroflexota bacterium]